MTNFKKLLKYHQDVFVKSKLIGGLQWLDAIDKTRANIFDGSDEAVRESYEISKSYGEDDGKKRQNSK